MTEPSGLFIDSGGNIISADSKNDRIQVRISLAFFFQIKFDLFHSYFPLMVNIKQHLNSMNV
jgi:hypothetical protein